MNNDININRQHEQDLEELRTRIKDRGWKDSTEFTIGDIEFLTDLDEAKLLARSEMRQFFHETQIVIDTLVDCPG